MSSNPLVRKLQRFQAFDTEDVALLERHSHPVRRAEAKQDIIRAGDKPYNVNLVVSGFACRYKLTDDGSRQIVAYLVPGDFCDLNVFILDQMDHSISALSACQLVEIPRNAIVELMERPAIARAFWWTTLVDEAILREWLVNMGQRPAEERIAHLLCEILVRLQVVGLVTNGTYSLPMTQTDIADTMGLTVVHVNRMLTSLRERGLVSINDREVMVRDIERLEQFSGFDPAYLHLDRMSGDQPDRTP